MNLIYYSVLINCKCKSAKRCLHLKKEKTLLGAFACRCETSRRIVESSSGVSSPVAVTCRIGRYWQCKQCRHFTAACKDWILCPRGYSGYWHGSQQITQPSLVMCVYWYWHYLMQNIVTMAASVSSPDWPIVCLLIMLVAGGSWHRHNGAVCVTAWHGRDANCGNIIYSGHTLYRLQTPSHWTPLLKLIIWGRAVSLPLTLSSLLVTIMSITIVRYLEVMQRLGTRPRSLTTAMAMQWNANFIINIWNLGHSAHSLLPRRQQKLHRK